MGEATPDDAPDDGHKAGVSRYALLFFAATAVAMLAPMAMHSPIVGYGGSAAAYAFALLIVMRLLRAASNDEVIMDV